MEQQQSAHTTPSVVAFASSQILHIFRKDNNHNHGKADYKTHVGFYEEAVIDIARYKPVLLEAESKDQDTSGQQQQSKKPVDGDNSLQLVSLDVSPDSKFICTTDNQKKVYIFSYSEQKSWDLFSTSQLKNRALAKIQFTKCMTYLVMTDKSGDVYISRIQPDTNNLIDLPKRILGHCSFITDTILTLDQKFILTSDRDHKIRMSQFPDAHNIDRYFLAHTESVQSIVLLNSDTVLVSVSETGGIIIWERKPDEPETWFQFDKISLSIQIGFITIKKAFITNNPMDMHKILVVLQCKSDTGYILRINIKEPEWKNACQLLTSFPLTESNELLVSQNAILQYDTEKNTIREVCS